MWKGEGLERFRRKMGLLVTFLSVALIFFFFSSVAVSSKPAVDSSLQFTTFQRAFIVFPQRNLLTHCQEHLPRGLSSFSGLLTLILTSSLCSPSLEVFAASTRWLPPGLGLLWPCHYTWIINK